MKVWQYYLVDSGDADHPINIPYARFCMHSYDEEDAAVAAAEHAYNRDPTDTELNYSYEMVLIGPDGSETRWGICHNARVTHSATRQDEPDEPDEPGKVE